MEPTAHIAVQVAGQVAELSKQITKAFGRLKADYRVVEALLRGNYEQYLSQSLMYYSRICSVIDPTLPIELEKIYVPLTLQSETKDKKIEVDRFPAALFRRSPQNLVIDSAGMGKSTLSKYIFLHAAFEKALLPIFVELRKLGENERLLTFISKELALFKGTDFSEEIVLHLLRSGLFLLILDGVDEVATGQRAELGRGVKELLVGCPHLPLLITSRSDPLLTEFPVLARWNIAPLTREKAYRLIHQYERNKEVADRLVTTLKGRRRRDPIETFLGTPLLVVLLVSSYEEKQIIPIQRSTFYFQVFDALFERHDSVKGGYVRQRKCDLSLDRFHKVLRAFCFTLLTNGITSFDKPTFFSTMELASQLFPDAPCDSDAFLVDLLSAVPLLVCEGSKMRFVHKSMADYFAAEYVCRDLKEKQAEFLATVYRSKQVNRFSETLRFAADIDFATFQTTFLRLLAQDIVTHERAWRSKLAKCKLHPDEAAKYIGLRFFCRLFLLQVPNPPEKGVSDAFGKIRAAMGPGLEGIDSISVFLFDESVGFGLDIMVARQTARARLQ